MSARIVLVLCLAASSAWASVPGRIHVNGALSDSDDRPVDGERSVRFSLYSQETAGEAFFTETLTVLFHKGAFFAELGGTTPLDLDLLVASKDSVWLGVAIGDGEELSPRLRMGSVPLSAYAHRAGSAAEADRAKEATHAQTATQAETATRADVATTAETLAGAGAGAYRKVADPIPFTELVNVPAGLEDGDNDLFATLKCATGQAAIFDGAKWNCALPFSSKRCEPGMVVTGVDELGNLECAVDKDTDTDTDTKYTGANFAVSNKACGANLVMGGVNADGTPLCIEDKDTITTVTARIGGGLVVGTGNVMGLQAGCSAGHVLKSAGSNNWDCEPDKNDTYDGNDFATSGQTCTEGAVMVGLDYDGKVQCSTEPIRDYVNSKCHLYVGWSDNCESCDEPTKWIKVNNSTCNNAGGSCLVSDIMTRTDLQVARFNYGGSVDKNDRMFFAFMCE